MVEQTTKTPPTLAMLRQNRKEIIELAYQHGASNIRVFGSVARGEATPSSDIDLLVDWDYSRISSWGGAGLFIELEALLGYPVDIGTPEQLRPHIRERVLKDCVAL